MLVHSWGFLFAFLPLTVLGYFLLQAKGGPRAARVWLVAASLLFYASSGPHYLPLLVGSILANRLLARAMATAPQGEARRRRLLLAGLVLNIGLLVFFKYADMLLTSLAWIAEAQPALLRLALPLGISFFTLQQIAYLLDVYEDLAKPVGLLDHALFVSFFPHVMAGPIVRLRQTMPQFDDPANRRLNWDNMARGAFVLALGLFKKIVVADSLARFVANGFDAAPALSLVEAWAASLCFTLQLYYDFSGYVDVVTGAALFLNVRLPRNFDSPLKSASLIEFWRRWHITLSNFITTYLYTPMVRAWGEITFTKSLLAVVLTMCIVGLWHGAAWTFGVFGLLHGLGLAANHWWRKRKIKLPKAAGWFLTMQLVNLGFVFFRARDFAAAFKVLRGMTGLTGLLPQDLSPARFLLLDPLQFEKVTLFIGMGYLDTVAGMALAVCGAAGALALTNSTRRLDDFKPSRRALFTFAACMLASLVFLNSFVEKGFVYRDF